MQDFFVVKDWIFFNININIKENRKVYLNNNWQVKDSIGSPAFQAIIEEDPNIDWLTFISENINY